MIEYQLAQKLCYSPNNSQFFLRVWHNPLGQRWSNWGRKKCSRLYSIWAEKKNEDVVVLIPPFFFFFPFQKPKWSNKRQLLLLLLLLLLLPVCLSACLLETFISISRKADSHHTKYLSTSQSIWEVRKTTRQDENHQRATYITFLYSLTHSLQHCIRPWPDRLEKPCMKHNCKLSELWVGLRPYISICFFKHYFFLVQPKYPPTYVMLLLLTLSRHLQGAAGERYVWNGSNPALILHCPACPNHQNRERWLFISQEFKF